jgi:hypothetical protein
MKRNQYNAVYKLQDLFEYLKECHSNLPTHVFEDLGEIIHDLKNPEGGTPPPMEKYIITTLNIQMHLYLKKL